MRGLSWAGIVSVVLILGAAPARPQEQHAAPPNLIVPQSRSYNFWPQQEGPVHVTGVEAKIIIWDEMASTRLDIEMLNTTDRIQMGLMMIPTPDASVVWDVRYGGDDWDMEAQILRKEEAERIFNALVAAVRDPALVELAGQDLLVTRLFPIEPGAGRKISIAYAHMLEFEGGRVDYHLPRTESLQYDVPWKINATIHSAQPISTVYSPSHHVTVGRVSEKEVVVELKEGAELAPGPFQLSFLRQDDGVSGSVFAYPDEDGSGGYFLLLAGLPAELPSDVEPMKRELTLVLDRSGSMGVTKMDQAKDVTQQIISALEPEEAFNIVTYNSSVSFFSTEPVIKDVFSEAAAWEYVEAVRSGGGTNLHEALRLSLTQEPMAGMLPIVLFLTDGRPTSGITSEVAIRELVTSSNPYDRRVFTFGVGLDVNAALLQGLAELSRARAEFVLPTEDVEEKVGKVFKGLKGPVLSNGMLQVLTADGSEAIGRTWDIAPATLPDLYDGDKLVFLGRYIGDEPLVFKVSGTYLGQDRTFEFAFDPADADLRHTFVPRLWASRKIAEMIYEIRQLGADPSLSPDDPRLLEVTDTVVSLSIEYGILTEYTAFLADETTDLADPDQTGDTAGDTIYDRGVRARSGGGGVNQSINLREQRNQEVLNRDNSYVDQYMQTVRVTNVQQVSDLAFYFRDEMWVDSRLVSDDLELDTVTRIDFGSVAFMQLVKELTSRGRQGVLSFGNDVLLQVGGEPLLVRMPAEAPKYDPEPTTQTDTGGSGGSGGGVPRR
ncbi:MAG: VWA domain-containing protein [Phycisphaerales bacterium]|nr:MAG: VWA domain-containing protein [Phycisphaerales bacterium]